MLHFIPTPIGNLEDITLRSLTLLGKATVILCEDTRVTKKLLKLLEEKFSLNINVEKFISIHSHNEKEILQNLDKNIFNENVVYLSDAGMPCVSDPGCYLVEYCIENSIEYEVLPGANAVTLAYASSGFCEKEFLFYGFLPHKGREREINLQNAINSGFVAILYESPHRLIKLIEQICDIDEDRKIFLIKEATKLHHKIYKDSAKKILNILQNETIKGEWVVVVDSAKRVESKITQKDILELDIPKKQKAKLLSKMTGKSIKEIYNELI